MVLRCFKKCTIICARIYQCPQKSMPIYSFSAPFRYSFLHSTRTVTTGTPPPTEETELENKEAAKIQKRDYQFKVTIIALQTYKLLNGDMHVPRRFIVPTNDRRWPKETWAIDLGSAMWAINRRFSYTDKSDELALIGIIPIVEERVSNFPRVVEALLHYQKLMGNMNVPKEFKIDAMNFNWPENTRGLKLGKIVYNIRKGMTYVQKRKYLESIGFQYLATSFDGNGDTIEYEGT